MTDKPQFARSEELWARAKARIPLGTQTFSKSPNQFVLGMTPKFLEKGLGARVWDVDGNSFIDCCMACQPIILGYCDPDVNAAIIDQLSRGIVFSLSSPLEVEVAELLNQMIPCAEMARFGKNGADATSAAVRIARSVTGREHIAYCGYHGWHDWYIANTDLNKGIPAFNQELAHAFTYNDLDSVQRIFEAYPGQIACVIMEPLQTSAPLPGFMEGVRDIAHANGALLVFDEIITGFRFHQGGAQSLLGVTPDLACFAKAMSNGMPVSAIVGKREYMRTLEQTFFSFTYGGEALSLAAAKATMTKIRDQKVVDHLWRVGARLKDGVNEIASRLGLLDVAECVGYPCRTIMSFKPGRFQPLELKTLFQQEMIKRGVLFAGYHSLSLAHDDAVIDEMLSAYEGAFGVLKKISDSNHSIAGHLEGPVVQPVFRKVSDFMASTINSGKR